MIRRLSLLLFVLAACHRKHGDAFKVVQITASGARACATMKDRKSVV